MIPKFRAWDKKVKEMIEDVASIHFKAEMITTSNLYFYPFKDIELMKSTELTDKNGKEIFEGDVVNVSIVDCEPKIFANKKCTGIVSFVNGHTDIEIESGTYLGLPCLECTGTYDLKFEVIGNIHEHSHLLDDGGQ